MTGEDAGGEPRSGRRWRSVLEAARMVKAKLIKLAAHLLEAGDDIEQADGHYRVRGVPGRGLSVTEIAREAYRGQRLPPTSTAIRSPRRASSVCCPGPIW